MPTIGILLPHQLFRKHELITHSHRLFIVEEPLFFRQFNFHKQKLAFHRASMKALQADLETAGHHVTYIDSDDPKSDVRVLINHLSDEGIDHINLIDPTDEWLEQRIKTKCDLFDIHLHTFENPAFINKRKDLSPFFRKDKKVFRQTTFYKQQRKELHLLVDENDHPTGGDWTYDKDNRKKYPKGQTPPTVNFPENSTLWEEAVKYVNTHFSQNLGEIRSTPLYPITPQQAEAWLDQFLDFRFHHFGDYEDALVQSEHLLHHSLLSPLLNTGLLDPLKVVERSIAYAEENDVPINNTEGFVRQIVGWREFIRGMYDCKGNASRTANFWGFNRKIPSSFYTGDTGIVPIDQTIKKSLKTGYAHHIERLMVLGNFMLLCEFDPDEVYRWFMEFYIDAYDWVMVPNVYGMSQFADGGLFATKPYIAGSNYLRKMGDYPSGDWEAIWDGLFWRFISTQKDFFSDNPRLAMIVNTWEKMNAEKQQHHLSNAEKFLESLG